MRVSPHTSDSLPVDAQPSTPLFLGNFPPLHRAPRFPAEIGGVAVTFVLFTRDEWEALPAEGRPRAFVSTDGRAVLAALSD